MFNTSFTKFFVNCGDIQIFTSKFYEISSVR